MTFSNKRIVQTSKALSVVALIAILSVVALYVRYVVMKPIQSIVNQGDGLEYIDYNNPITSIATAIKIHQEVAYVGLADRLLIYDVSNGDAPIYIGGSEKLCRVQGGSECIISDIEVAEDNLYVAISNWIPPVNDSGAVSVPPSTEYYQSHIVIFNVVAPTKPEIVGWAPVTGGAADIEIHNNRMFVASAGEGISVFVLQNGHGTQFIGSLQLGNARNLARRGEYLFVTIEGDVPSDFGASASGGNAHAGNQISESRVVVGQIVNTSTTGVPLVEIASVAIDQIPTGLTVGSSHLYVSVVNGLMVIDISDTSHPVIVGSERSWNKTNGVVKIDSMTVALLESKIEPLGPIKGIEMIDVSNPIRPTVISDVLQFNGVFDGVSVEHSLFVAAGDGLNVIDTEDRHSPVIIANSTTTRSWVSDVLLEGNTAFLADMYRGVRIYDVSDRSAPVMLSSLMPWDIDGYGTPMIAKDSDQLFVAIKDKLFVVNVSDLENPTLVGDGVTINDSVFSDVTGIAIGEKLLYVAIAGDGLKIIDVSDIEEPTVVGFIRSRETDSIVVSGDVLIMPAIDGLGVYDVSNPSSPSLISMTGPAAQSFAIKSGSILFTIDAFRGALAYDVSSYETPVNIGIGMDVISVNDVDISGAYMIAVGIDGGIITIDTHNPTNLKVSRDDDVSGYGVAIDCADELCVIARGDGMDIVEVSAGGDVQVSYRSRGPG